MFVKPSAIDGSVTALSRESRLLPVYAPKVCKDTRGFLVELIIYFAVIMNWVE